MSREELLIEAQDVVRNVLGDDDIVLEESATASDYDGWDSVAHANILLAIEEKFGITLPMSKAWKVNSVGELIDLVYEIKEAG